mmetsp:Transcript_3181/g.4971  ORF Transcript_3181/g.4971 Transcript_3181/m.4971 type:complete len:564 (-) Transcript_3181:349-2040(-)
MTSRIDHTERRLVTEKSIRNFSADDDEGPQSPTSASLPNSVVELSNEIQILIKKKPSSSSNSAEDSDKEFTSSLRRYASKLCSIGNIEACDCFLQVIKTDNITSPSIAKYGLTTIANCTGNEESRARLLADGAGEFIVHCLKLFGEEHYAVAQYGIIAITNLTSSQDVRSKLGSLGVCQLIVKMLKIHGYKDETPVAVYGLYSIGKLSLNHDQNRQRFGAAGGCEEVVLVLQRLGLGNHTITDYGMYALAHLAYFNLENKKRLSHMETYKVILQLVKAHGKEQISIASFGLTAVSNLIHTDASKDRFGQLGMCQLVQELGEFYQMKPEALANNVIFTIGKLTHKHPENGKLLGNSGAVLLVVQALKLYALDKVTQAGNGLFALGALIQNNPDAIKQIYSADVAELLVELIVLHGTSDASVATYGLNVLEALCIHARMKNDIGDGSSTNSSKGAVFKALVNANIGTVAMHILTSYVFNMHNSNTEIASRVVNLLLLLMRLSSVAITAALHSKSDKIVTKNSLKDQLMAVDATNALEELVVNNISITDKVVMVNTEELISKLAVH